MAIIYKLDGSIQLQLQVNFALCRHIKPEGMAKTNSNRSHIQQAVHFNHSTETL
jgi:hypothetical protein